MAVGNRRHVSATSNGLSVLHHPSRQGCLSGASGGGELRIYLSRRSLALTFLSPVPIAPTGRLRRGVPAAWKLSNSALPNPHGFSAILLVAIDILTVPNSDDFDNQHIVVDFVNHTVISDSYPISTFAAAQLLTAIWSWIRCQGGYSTNDAGNNLRRYFPEILSCRASPLNPVGVHLRATGLETPHAQPSVHGVGPRWPPDLPDLRSAPRNHRDPSEHPSLCLADR